MRGFDLLFGPPSRELEPAASIDLSLVSAAHDSTPKTQPHDQQTDIGSFSFCRAMTACESLMGAYQPTAASTTTKSAAGCQESQSLRMIMRPTKSIRPLLRRYGAKWQRLEAITG